jgi:hemerythrin-like domain-containing protein
MNSDRRKFVGAAVIAGLAGAWGNGSTIARAADDKPSAGKDKKEEEVSPGEDLMREHGILKRILLIYGEAIHRLHHHLDVPPQAIADAAGLVRSFVEDYHEKLEEDFLFPRFRKANKLVDLVAVLEAQHKAGRKLTDVTIRLAKPQMLKSASDRHKIILSMQHFIRMYSPHEAREDTVLFPAFHDIVSQHEYYALGEDFEKKEDQLFGDEGFEKNVDRVAAIEKTLGIYDLAQFTPKV